jgi:hypothetical protein
MRNFESANDVPMAVAIPANNAISKDEKRRTSQTATIFLMVAVTPLRTNRTNSRINRSEL